MNEYTIPKAEMIEDNTVDYLVEKDNVLIRIEEDRKLTINKGSGGGLNITATDLYCTVIRNFEQREVDLLAYWLSKNFPINFLPGFKEAIEYRNMKEESEKNKELINDSIDRMNELSNMVKRLTSILVGIVEADSLKSNCLSQEALNQITKAIEDANDIQS